MRNSPLSMNDLSKILHVENSTVTGLIDRLEKSNFVQRTPDFKDRRKWNVSITDNGIEEIERAGKIIKKINNKIEENNTKEDIEAFKRVLNSFFGKFNN